MYTKDLGYLAFMRVFIDAMLEMLLVILQFIVIAVCTKTQNKWLVFFFSK